MIHAAKVSKIDKQGPHNAVACNATVERQCAGMDSCPEVPHSLSMLQLYTSCASCVCVLYVGQLQSSTFACTAFTAASALTTHAPCTLSATFTLSCRRGRHLRHPGLLDGCYVTPADGVHNAGAHHSHPPGMLTRLGTGGSWSQKDVFWPGPHMGPGI